MAHSFSKKNFPQVFPLKLLVIPAEKTPMDYDDQKNYGPFANQTEDDSAKSLSSYSDLFTALSFAFLFLYIISSIQNAVQNVALEHKKKQEEEKFNHKLTQIIQEHQKMMTTYEVERKKYLDMNATEQEKEYYTEALYKLSQLEQEKESLKKFHEEQYKENEEKVQLINSFTGQLKQIIHSNVSLKQMFIKQQQEKINLERKVASVDEELKTKYEDEYQKKIVEVENKAQMENHLQALKMNQLAQIKISEEKNQIEKRTQKEYEEQMMLMLKMRDNAMANKLKDVTEVVAQKEKEFLAMKRKMNEEAVLTKGLAQQLENDFKQHGINAHVDKVTGEVSINFDQFYFDKAKYELKPEMMEVLKKAVPLYAKNLFSQKKLVNKIDHFEIIGYSSPLYGGKILDLSSVDSKNFEALNSNLDLSYRRAKSIFKFIFSPDKINFEEKEQMLRLTRVSGRSSLDGRAPASEEDKKISAEEFCQKYKCYEQQKVVIKFTLKP